MLDLIPPSLHSLFAKWAKQKAENIRLYETEPFAALEAFREERRRCRS
jgi:hypothetical protein